MTHLVFELTHHVDQGRPVVQLVEPLEVRDYTVPARFRTDFASIPAGVRWLLPVFGRSCRAAVLHDWLCYIGLDRAARSRLFLAEMLHDGVPRWQAYLQWAAVRFWPGSEKVGGEIVAA